MKTLKKYALTLCTLGAMAVTPLMADAASGPQPLGQFGDWRAFEFRDEAGEKVCFMSSKPKKDEGNYTRRGDIFAYVTHWPSKGHRNMINIDAGYTYKPNSTVSLAIGNDKFTLATEGEKAWAYDQSDDDKISDAIKHGSRMIIKGTSSRGTLTTDTYSLSGTSKALEAINEACGISS